MLTNLDPQSGVATPSRFSRETSERVPLLYAFPRSTSPLPTYSISRSASPKSSPAIYEYPPLELEIGKWKRWIGGAGIKAEYEWPYRPGWRRSDLETIGGKQSDTASTASRYKENIPADGLVIPLFLITFSCAMADAGTLVAYQTFATSMTGNTVLLAVSTFGLSHKPPIYAAASLFTFVGAGLVFGQMGGVIGHRRRSWLLSSLIFQIVLLMLSAWTVSPLGWEGLRVGERVDWVYLLLIGLQGGPQVTLAANAGVRELPTAMMTTPYAAFISDPSLFSFPSKRDPSSVISRNRRFIYILIFWTGAFIGSALMRYSSLWVLTALVAGIKTISAGLIWISKGDSVSDMDSLNDGDERSRGGSEEEAVDISTMESSLMIDPYRPRKRTSSVFEVLSRQRPRNEQNVAM